MTNKKNLRLIFISFTTISGLILFVVFTVKERRITIESQIDQNACISALDYASKSENKPESNYFVSCDKPFPVTVFSLKPSEWIIKCQSEQPNETIGIPMISTNDSVSSGHPRPDFYIKCAKGFEDLYTQMSVSKAQIQKINKITDKWLLFISALFVRDEDSDLNIVERFKNHLVKKEEVRKFFLKYNEKSRDKNIAKVFQRRSFSGLKARYQELIFNECQKVLKKSDYCYKRRKALREYPVKTYYEIFSAIHSKQHLSIEEKIEATKLCYDDKWDVHACYRSNVSLTKKLTNPKCYSKDFKKDVEIYFLKSFRERSAFRRTVYDVQYYKNIKYEHKVIDYLQFSENLKNERIFLNAELSYAAVDILKDLKSTESKLKGSGKPYLVVTYKKIPFYIFSPFGPSGQVFKFNVIGFTRDGAKRDLSSICNTLDIKRSPHSIETIEAKNYL